MINQKITPELLLEFRSTLRTSLPPTKICGLWNAHACRPIRTPSLIFQSHAARRSGCCVCANQIYHTILLAIHKKKIGAVPRERARALRVREADLQHKLPKTNPRMRTSTVSNASSSTLSRVQHSEVSWSTEPRKQLACKLHAKLFFIACNDNFCRISTKCSLTVANNAIADHLWDEN